MKKKLKKIEKTKEIFEIISDSKYSKDVFKSEIMPKENYETNINNLYQEKDSFNDDKKKIANSLIELNKENLKDIEEEKKLLNQNKIKDKKFIFKMII